MTVKEYFTFSKAPGLESHHQMQFNVIPRTLTDEGGAVLLPAETQLAYSTAAPALLIKS